jgi:hypothetical protein
MKKFFLSFFAVIVIAIICIAGYISYDYLQKKNSLQFSPIPSPQNTVTNATSTDSFATSTIDRTSWKYYENVELGYGLKYPEDLIVNFDEKTLILSFPVKTYFHWPLEDKVKITVTASSTCLSLGNNDKYGQSGSVSDLVVDAHKFTRTKISDVAAGNVYNTVTYEIMNNGFCYSLEYYSHGSNGAGLYVDNPDLIKKYDNQHKLDVDNVTNIIHGILESFDFVLTPDGDLEG